MLSLFSSFSLLTKSTTFIIGDISNIFGIIMNAIYNVFFDMFSIQSLGITIIVFTVLVRVLMLPLAVKQQKSTQEMQRIQPELKKLQNKYANKKDPESQKKYQAEMQALYQEHGVNPFGGCLPLLIQMPIIFALFAVLRNIPAYIVKVKDVFLGIYSQISTVDGFADKLSQFNHMDLNNMDSAAIVKDFDPAVADSAVDVMAKLTPEGWNMFQETFAAVGSNIEGLITKINDMNYFLSINLAERPINGFEDIFTVGALIPLLCLVAQVLVTKTMQSSRNTSKGDGGAADQTQKTMMYIMPIMTVFIVSTMPAGLGLYWLASNVFQLGQQIVINRHLAQDREKNAGSSKKVTKK